MVNWGVMFIIIIRIKIIQSWVEIDVSRFVTEEYVQYIQLTSQNDPKFK